MRLRFILSPPDVTTDIAAKLARPDIAAPVRGDGVRADGERASSLAPASLPTVMFASLAIHGAIALALLGLPLTASVACELEETWVSFDLEPAPPEPALAPTEPAALPPPPPVEPEPERIVRHERPLPTPEAPPPAAAPDPIAPPSLDDVFAEPAPPAAVLTGEGAGGFAVAPGELGGMVGGTPGGHGTSLVSTVRPAPAVDPGPSEADRRRARRGYVHAVEELVRAHTRYPRAASREGLQGRVELALRISNDGRVLAIRVATTSGHGILDDAALEAAREIDRVPSPPAVAALAATDEVRVGVVYVVR